MRISDLVGWDRNPRKISPEALTGLEQSIRSFGLVQPIIWNKRTERVVGGHQRLKALANLGEESTEVVVVDMDEDKEKALNVALNNQHIAGEFDDTLDDLLKEISTWDENLFDSLRLDELMSDILDDEDEKKEIDPEYVADPGDAESVAKVGDVWTLGEHTLICGDMRHPEVLKSIGKTDVCLTDPPYGIDYQGGVEANRKKIANDSIDGFEEFIHEAMKTISEVVAPGGACLVFHADTMGHHFRSAYMSAGFHLSSCCIWVKDNATLSRQDWHWRHEPCLYGWREGAAHKWYGDRKQTTVWEFDRPKRSEKHPTMKPVDLIEYLILNVSKKGNTVFDPFCGSGTTLMACHTTGRRCVGVELDPMYVDVIVDRYQSTTGQVAERTATLDLG
jgi:DNA modification methylase